MSKKILVLVGSARKSGNTEALADAFISGASDAGNEVVKIVLSGRKIGGCMDCKYCYAHDGECVLKDGMTEIYDAMAKADALVLASPVYFYNFSSQMKAVIDRLHSPVREKFAVKEVVLLSVCADEGKEVFAPMIATYRAICGYLGWNDAGVITLDNCEERGAAEGRPEMTAAMELGRRI